MTEERQAPEPYIYPDLVEVPPAFKVLAGGLLNVHDVNAIMQRAYDLGFWTQDEDGNDIAFIPHYGQARAEFKDSHVVENGVWVKKDEA